MLAPFSLVLFDPTHSTTDQESMASFLQIVRVAIHHASMSEIGPAIRTIADARFGPF